VPKDINDLKDYLALDAAGLADTVFHCPECGRDHLIPIKRISVGEGLALRLSEIAEEALGRKPRKTALIYDRAIEGIVLDALAPVAGAMKFANTPLGDGKTHLDSTDTLGDEVAGALDADVDFLVGAGSGVIADLAKWIATRRKIPFALFATASSMNAHASITATMTSGGVKTSAWLDPARAVLFDIGVIKDAPREMRLAGLGDLAARAICNADWKLGELIRGTRFCPVPYRMTQAGEDAYFRMASGIGKGESQATRVLSEATLVSALSMTMMAGDTSPSSGCEHAFSHYWDLQTEIEGAEKNLHGIQVGLGTLLSLSLWERMKSLDPRKIDVEGLAARRIPKERLSEENAAKFKDKAPLFDKAIASKWIPEGDFSGHLRRVVDGWDAMWTALGPYVGEARRVRKALEDAGFDLSLEAIKRTRRQALDALVYGARYRARYTMLDLAGDLGLLPGAAEEVMDGAGLA